MSPPSQESGKREGVAIWRKPWMQAVPNAFHSNRYDVRAINHTGMTRRSAALFSSFRLEPGIAAATTTWTRSVLPPKEETVSITFFWFFIFFFNLLLSILCPSKLCYVFFSWCAVMYSHKSFHFFLVPPSFYFLIHFPFTNKTRCCCAALHLRLLHTNMCTGGDR